MKEKINKMLFDLESLEEDYYGIADDLRENGINDGGSIHRVQGCIREAIDHLNDTKESIETA